MYFYTTIDGILVKSTKPITSSNFTSLTEEEYNQRLAELIEEDAE